MTSLQGTVGKHYALRDGIDQQVAQAIEDHYLPRQAGGKSPDQKPGLVVGLADRLDSLVGLFAVNMAPTGTKDPFGLRRAAIGLLQNLIHSEINFDLNKGIEIAASSQPFEVSLENQQACFDFIVGRLQNMLLEDGYKYDVVNAVLTEQGANPYAALLSVIELSKWVEKDTWAQILPAFSRCARITRDLTDTFKVNPKNLNMDEEKTLLAHAESAEKIIQDAGTIETFLIQTEKMVGDINTFFENVLVMDKDPKVKQNRLAILQKISALSTGLADLSQLEGF